MLIIGTAFFISMLFKVLYDVPLIHTDSLKQWATIGGNSVFTLLLKDTSEC